MLEAVLVFRTPFFFYGVDLLVHVGGDEVLCAQSHDHIFVSGLLPSCFSRLYDEKSAVAAAVASQMGGQKLKKRRPSFREHTAENGKSYYPNVETGETTWKKPADEDMIM
jgi:hypothetical protein